MNELALPPRYEPIDCLGRGGGGEVWAVRDRSTGVTCALKVLSLGATQREMQALVREAVALSGLEGLGVPRVLRFGRLPGSARPFLVRELVKGESLQHHLEERAPLASLLAWLAKAAEQLTLLHRAGFLHGDIKPANIIVEPGGASTLVDLGLVAPWQEGGARPEGLTPHYAAPELFRGEPLTVRAEVFALGVALREALTHGSLPGPPADTEELLEVAARATREVPSERFPSADEFASAVRRAGGLSWELSLPEAQALWPIVGIEHTSHELLTLAQQLEPARALAIVGPEGSGRSVLLRRLAWSLELEAAPVIFVDEPRELLASLQSVLAAPSEHEGPFVLVDDADGLSSEEMFALEEVRNQGARLVLVGTPPLSVEPQQFQVPALEPSSAAELVRRAVPSLTDRHLTAVVEASLGRPGALRAIVGRIAREPVASIEDLKELLGPTPSSSLLPENALDRARHLLDRGRLKEVAGLLASATLGHPQDQLAHAVLKARHDIALGEPAQAVERLRAAEALLEAAGNEDLRAEWQLFLGRALVGTGAFEEALSLLRGLSSANACIRAEARAYEGLGLLLQGQGEAAEAALEDALEQALKAGSPRLESIALGSLALAAQRSDHGPKARDLYERGIGAAELAGDAGMLATLQLNLAGLLKIQGDIAAAIHRFEAALDMGQRAGRRATVRQALLNLTNLDLYLGCLAKARSRIELLEQQREQLPAETLAQLLGLRAELLLRNGELEAAADAFEASASAYEGLGRGIDAAEARLEGVLALARLPHPDPHRMRRLMTRARAELGDTAAHRPLAHLAEARLAALDEDDAVGMREIEAALGTARETGQREWLWRGLQIRAELEQAAGHTIRARRDREEALAVLEEIASRLPRDLREVYWNDARRREIRLAVRIELGTAGTEHHPPQGSIGRLDKKSHTTSSHISSVTSTPLEQRLARILEVNHDLVGVVDLERLTGRIIDSAVSLLHAERGAVLLVEPDGNIQLYTSRQARGADAQLEFSRSIAERVIRNCEPIVSQSARDDALLKGYASVHQMMLQSVACVPIRGPQGSPIGALYLETRLLPGAQFEAELPTLMAFADQMAIALENARLINENRDRADALLEANQKLEEAQVKLAFLLESRTEKLKETRRRLRDVQETLYGHFGYQGLVGTSAAMRRVYALMERVKDTDVPVLITGESGTGKEVVARAIHDASPRAKGKFLGLNCGAIPENLLESELFGHTRGAFTGADRDRKGLFREATGGTILLDEIGETPHKMQAGLLRVLQDRKVRPVGGNTEEEVDTRVLFATNRDLEALVAAGRFREDLYYRIHVVELHLPPLRERPEDIPQLVDHFLGLFAARYKREKKTLSRDAMRALVAYGWPGNVRQLEHVLLNAWVLSDGPELEASDIDLPQTRSSLKEGPASVEARLTPTRAAASSVAPETGRSPSTERDQILEALQACNWNRVRAAALIGIPRRTFYRRLRDYGIQ